jgi:DNA polymerase III delta prime subunit
MPIETLDRIALAARMINNTGRHVFLTGKAGTGKTTFLHELAKATHKNFLIVAPTGIAALNAGGVTIHSQFLLPFGSFLPGDNTSAPQAGAFYTRLELAKRHPLNSIRKKVVRSIDLLIIDEVSMLRADLLDAIDYRLRSAKGNFRQSFGGVQLLMIGDLFQLPPIVKDEEWHTLRQYYRSAHFFEAQSLKQDGFVYVELEKIFRQSDQRFIDLLNNLRNNTCSAEDIQALNACYEPRAQTEEGVITLTTHNHQAESINRRELDKLPGSSYFYRAEIKGDFPENLYPLPEKLELKLGAQVMFVKNDTVEKRFYNGKIAKITALDSGSITVLPQDEDRALRIGMVTWENKKYQRSDTSGEMQEDVVGGFTQYPIKTAWAITVHKSQGLTFDKAVVDVGQAFAPGQVYVALSRLRSLEGLRLRTKINPSVISSDPEVIRFSSEKQNGEPLNEVLREAQRAYLHEALKATYDFGDIERQIAHALQKMEGKLDFEDAEMNISLFGLHAKLRAESANTSRFRRQIEALLSAQDFDQLRERIEKGSAYYLKFLKDCNLYLLTHIAEVEMLSRTKTYLNLLHEIDQLMHDQTGAVLKAMHLTDCIANDRNVDRNPALVQKRKAMRDVLVEKVKAYLLENPKNLGTKSGRKRKAKDVTRSGKSKPEKGETYQITKTMFEAGKGLDEIAKERELAKSTIETHLSKLVSEGEIPILKVIAEEELENIVGLMQKNEGKSFGEIFNIANGRYSYSKLRMVQEHLQASDGNDDKQE